MREGSGAQKNMQMYSFRIYPETKGGLDKIALRRGVDTSALCREVLEAFVAGDADHVRVHGFEHPVIGQECVCPDGVGRVVEWCDKFPEQWIKVSTYIGDRGCKWAPGDIKLIFL